ncbi:MAG: glycosyltransferase family 4 protein [Phycisphaeraceae bacterium]
MTADTIGGVWTYAVDLIRALSRRHVRVHLVTFGKRPSPTQRREIANIASLSVTATTYQLEWMDNPWRDITAASALLQAIAEADQPDLVHLNQFCFGAQQWGAPVLVVGHSCVTTWMRAVRGEGGSGDRRWARYRQHVHDGIHGADCFVAPTGAMLQGFARCYGAHAWSQAIHNGRDASRFAPAPKRPFVFAAGRVWDEAKNLALLDAIAPRLAWPTLIAGATRSPTGRETRPEHARGLGPLPPAVVARYMARAPIYALPARYEPFGLSAVEAALSGAALVLGDISTLREVWADAAVFVDPDDAEALADVINRLIAHPAQRLDYAQAAQLRARRYTAERIAERYLDLYNRLRERRRAPAAPARESA